MKNSTSFLLLASFVFSLCFAGARTVRAGEDPVRVGSTVEAIQLYRAGLPLPAPPESDSFLDSTRYPIRFHLPENYAISQSLAAVILGRIEQAWEAEVEGLGFDAAPPEADMGGDERLDFYVERFPGAAGVTVPLRDVAGTTDRYAVTSYVMLDPDVGLDCETIAHELNHVLQLGMDAAEDPTFLEATSVYVSTLVCQGEPYSNYFLDAFQARPYWALDHFVSGDAYPYGSYIFLQFLSEAYGEGDPAVVVGMWRDTMQFGIVNEPDFLDLAAQIGAPAGDGNLPAVLARFSEWRLLVGDLDDGAHFSNADRWTNAQIPAVSRTNVISQPVSGQRIAQVEETGTAYALLTNELNKEGTLRISYTSETPDFAWLVRAFVLRGGHSDAVVHSFAGPAVSGELDLPLEVADESVVLAFTAIGGGQSDPDDNAWAYNVGEAVYSLELRPAVEPGTDSEEGGDDAGLGDAADTSGDGDGCSCAATGQARIGLFAALLRNLL